MTDRTQKDIKDTCRLHVSLMSFCVLSVIC